MKLYTCNQHFQLSPSLILFTSFCLLSGVGALEEFSIFEDCPPGTWGNHCEKSCTNCTYTGCSRERGICFPCPAGWDPHFNCTEECPYLTFGFNCTGSCIEVCGEECEDIATGRCPLSTSNVRMGSMVQGMFKTNILFFIIPVAVLLGIIIAFLVVYSNRRSKSDQERREREQRRSCYVSSEHGFDHTYIIQGRSTAAAETLKVEGSSVDVFHPRWDQMRLGVPRFLSGTSLYSATMHGHNPRSV